MDVRAWDPTKGWGSGEEPLVMSILFHLKIVKELGDRRVEGALIYKITAQQH